MQRKFYGFTLIEVMIAVAIVVITTVVAIQAFSYFVRKGRRIDGINVLLAVSLAEERYRATNTSYGTLAQVWGGVTASPEGYYSLAISNVSATSYTITATAQGNQANDTANGTSCTPLILTLSNGAITRTPAVCWPN